MTAKDWKELFETNYADGTAGKKLWNALLWGSNGGTVDKINIDAESNLIVVPRADAYTLAYTGTVLDTVTRTSDSKVITLGYTGDNLTSVSDWT